MCIRHGARVKRCRDAGCPRQAVRGGACVRHGAQLRRCNRVAQVARYFRQASHQVGAECDGAAPRAAEEAHEGRGTCPRPTSNTVASAEGPRGTTSTRTTVASSDCTKETTRREPEGRKRPAAEASSRCHPPPKRRAQKQRGSIARRALAALESDDGDSSHSEEEGEGVGDRPRPERPARAVVSGARTAAGAAVPSATLEADAEVGTVDAVAATRTQRHGAVEEAAAAAEMDAGAIITSPSL